MSQKCIIHTATRVIRRVTTDDFPRTGTDESFVDMGIIRVDLAGGPYKLDVDNITLLTPTAQEIDDAFTVPQSTPLIELLQALTDVRDDTNLPPKIRLVCARLRQWFDRKIRTDV